MAHNMKEMRHALQYIADERQKFSFNESSSSNEQLVLDMSRETSSKVDEEFFAGRTEQKQSFISSCLSDNSNNKLTILPIYGIGGIGKTTFAKMVFNDIQFKDFSQVWVYVSQQFDLKKIGNSIISGLSEEERELTALERIQICLGMLLANKKVLIVLDDLWETDNEKLNKLKSMLNGRDNRKVIVIVTTRDREIANKFRTIEPYELPPLPVEKCWEIIKQKVEFDRRPDKDKLELVGREIALKCRGVALAARVIGSMLGSMQEVEEWESVCTSDIWNGFYSEDIHNQHQKVISSLLLSYNKMRPYLKLCFAYCATYAKGHKIVKYDLIYQWISLGFVEPGILSAWKNGQHYVNQLVGMSFLQYAEPPSNVQVHHEGVTLLTMHDLVHDLARSVMVNEILDASKKSNTSTSGIFRCRFALLNDCTKPLKSFTHSPVQIIALRYLESEANVLSDVSFSHAKYMRVLDLSKCSIRKLPDSINHLKQLRYLSAPRINKKVANCISKLSKLIYLSIPRSNGTLKLLKAIGEMEDLMYLDLSRCFRIGGLPMSFGKLKKLIHLDLSHCRDVTGVSESLESLTNLEYLNLSNCWKIGQLPRAIGNLSKLVYLNLSSSSYITRSMSEADVLGNLTKLEYLDLSSIYSSIKRLPEALSSFINLKYLNLSGFRELEELPASIGNLKNLTHLNLSGCRNIFKSRTTAEAIGNLKKLQYLSLSDLWMYRFDPEKDFSFLYLMDNLEHLVLSDNWYLKQLPDCFGNLKNLHTLDLSGCRNLTTLPESISKHESLKFIYMDGTIVSSDQCNKNSITLPRFAVQVNDDGSSSNLIVLNDVNPPELKISSLENVKSVKEVQMIKLREKQAIEELTLEWTEDVERSVEDMELLGELVPPSSLIEFQIRRYNGTEFPDWIMGIAPYLPNVVKITLYKMPKCVSLPPLCIK